jgi:hypothetical protein
MLNEKESALLEALEEMKRKHQSIFTDTYMRARFFDGIKKIESAIRETACKRYEKMDVDQAVRAFVRSQHPTAENIEFSVTFDSLEETRTEKRLGTLSSAPRGRRHLLNRYLISSNL